MIVIGLTVYQTQLDINNDILVVILSETKNLDTDEMLHLASRRIQHDILRLRLQTHTPANAGGLPSGSESVRIPSPHPFLRTPSKLHF